MPTEIEQPLLVTRYAPDMSSAGVVFECEHTNVSTQVEPVTPESWSRAVDGVRERVTCGCAPDSIVDIHQSLARLCADLREDIARGELGHAQSTMLVSFLGRYEKFACPTCDPTVWRRSVETDGHWRVLFGGEHGAGCPTPGFIHPKGQPEVIDTRLRSE